MSSRAMHHRSSGHESGDPGQPSAGAGGRMDIFAPRGDPCASGNMRQPATAGDVSAETARYTPYGDTVGCGGESQSTRYTPHGDAVGCGNFNPSTRYTSYGDAMGCGIGIQPTYPTHGDVADGGNPLRSAWYQPHGDVAGGGRREHDLLHMVQQPPNPFIDIESGLPQ
eukprot:1385101-Amphidinium_carterae.1